LSFASRDKDNPKVLILSGVVGACNLNSKGGYFLVPKLCISTQGDEIFGMGGTGGLNSSIGNRHARDVFSRQR